MGYTAGAGLDEDRFTLHFQTIRPLSTDGTGVHVEILIRLREPNGRLVMPDSFLPAAERFNLITRIDRWVLQHAIEALRAYLDHTNVELFASIYLVNRLETECFTKMLSRC